MNGYNRIFILGRLGSKPQVQTSKGGQQFTKLNVATNRVQQDELGEKSTQTDWFTINVWGRRGEMCARYLTTGQAIMVEGYLSTYTVEKNDDKKDSRIAIHATKVEFLSKPVGSSVAADIVPVESVQ